MATTLYLRVDTTPIRLPYGHQTGSSVLLGDGTSPVATSGLYRRLSTAAGPGGSASAWGSPNTSAAPMSPGTVSPTSIGYSMPVSGTFSLGNSEAVYFDCWANESSMNANASIRAILYAIKPDGSYSTIVDIWIPAELTTSSAQVSGNALCQSVTLTPGDVLCLALWIENAQGTTQQSGYSVSIGAEGAEGASYDSQIRFGTTTLTFASAPSGTTTNLLNDASDLSGSGNKKLWTDAVSGATNYNVTTVSAPNHAQWTDTTGGTALQWFTPQLQAVTLQGYASFGLEGIASSGISGLITVYKTDSDGSNPVQIGQGKTGTGFLSTSSYITGAIILNGTLTDGQRLKIVVSTASGQNNQGAGSTATLTVEDSQAASITWPATLAEYSSGPAPTDYWGAAA